MKYNLFFNKRLKFVLTICMMSVLFFSSCSKDNADPNTSNEDRSVSEGTENDGTGTQSEDDADSDGNVNTDVDSDGDGVKNVDKQAKDMTYQEYVDSLEASVAAQGFHSQIQTATTTLDMQVSLDKAVRFWDEELNSIYNQLIEKLSPEEQSTLRQEERDWMKMRDEKVTEKKAKNDSGTMASIHEANTLYEETKDRTYVLIKMYYGQVDNVLSPK